MNTTTSTKMNRRRLLRVSVAMVAVVTGGLLAAPAMAADAFPTKPLHIIHGGPAGGGLDIYARLLAEEMSDTVGQPVIVEAKPGASGTLAVNTLLGGQGNDGYTAMVNMDAVITELPHSIQISYDPFTDLQPLAGIYQTGLFLVAHPDFPANTVDELVAYVKSQPEHSVSYASYSAGTLSHALGLMLNKAADITLNHVAYKGTPPAMQDIMGGHVPLGFLGSSGLEAAMDASKVKLLAYSGPERSTLFPQVPTFADAGYADVAATVGVALFVPSTVPDNIQKKWRELTLTALEQPKIKERRATLGHSPVPKRTPNAMIDNWKVQYERIGALFGSPGT